MSNYNLNLLGTVEFEHLIQDLLKRIIGVGTITFGTGPDGVREPHMKAVGVIHLRQNNEKEHGSFRPKISRYNI